MKSDVKSTPTPDPVESSVERAGRLQLRLSDCERLLRTAPKFADGRWVDGVKGFRDTEGETAERHVVNTSTAISVIERCADIFAPSELAAYEGMSLNPICHFYRETYEIPGDGGISQGYWKSKRNNSWSPYVTALVLGALAECALRRSSAAVRQAVSDNDLGEILDVQTRKLSEYLLEWATEDMGDYDHVFFAFTACRSLKLIAESEDRLTIPPTALAAASEAVEASLFRFQREFYAQMTFAATDLRQHIDAAALILSLVSLSTYGSGLTEIPRDVRNAAFDVAFQLQQPQTGQWDTSTPLLGTETGRVGCSSIELMNWMLRLENPPSLDKHYDEIDRLFLPLVQQANLTDPAVGWPVDIRRSASARQTWYGCLVYEFAALFAARIRQHMARLILSGFRFRRSAPRFPWPKIADFAGFKSRIEDQVLKPRVDNDGPGGEPSCSLILFGPPGTGKTTVAHAIAHQLGWGFIELGPGDFLTNGLEGVFARGDLIFQRLLMLEQVVVLFDEIDELVAVRDADADKVSRFLTTYMLPWIQRLRDRGTVIFIFATNHVERFDPAIKRIDRVDLVLGIGPPQGRERRRVIAELLPQLNDAVLGAVESLPERATVGEIRDAVRQLERRGEDVTPESLALLVTPESLLITEEDWEDFLGNVAIHRSRGARIA